MRKFVFVADIHLKINRDAPVDWSFNRYRLLFKEIVKVCLEEEATLILAGDVVDNSNLKLSELKLLIEFLHLLKDNEIHTIIISGNHDKVGTNKSVFDYLHLDKLGKKEGYSFIHYNDWNSGWVFEDEHGKLECDLHPVSHQDIHAYDYSKGLKGTRPSILASHIRAEVPPFITEEAPIAEIAKNFDICILGDIHEPLSFGNVHYTNNPLNCCYESQPECGYIILTVDKGKCKVERVKTDFPNLIKHTITAEEFEDTILSLDAKHFYKIEVAGTAAELKAIPKSGQGFIVEKQIIEEIAIEDGFHITEDEVKHETIEDGLIWYMQQIEMQESDIKGMMDEYVQI